ncbi:MAG: glycosyltransferase family 4 protein [Bacillota bacterium]|nr:glycosyltransferase family 4 protein [Bacillota bacterium]
MVKEKLNIVMYSSADKVEGQGVGSAYVEQVRLVKEGASDLFDIYENDWLIKPDIQHFHTVDLTHFAKMQDRKATNIAYCHFLPDTLNGSLTLPTPVFSIFQTYLIQFYKSADRLVVVNPTFIDDLVKAGIPREKIYYIPNYVSKEKFYRKSEEDCLAVREKYGLNKEDFIVLGAGQVQHRKGVLDFVETAKKCPEVQFVWAGGFSFGRITDGYEELKHLQENPPKNVKFIGIVPREEMVNLYNIANVLFVPSYNELFPMTILEAVNLHVPLVLRSLSLYEEILFEKYLKANDNDSFAQLILQLKNDPALYAKYQKESQYISEYYSKEHVLSMWREFYLDAYKEKQTKILEKKNR